MSNITQVLNTDKNFTTLKKAVHASDLDQQLSSTGPFTVFAPSDLAFGKLENGAIDHLLKPENKADLTSMLQGHVVEGKIDFKDLKDGDSLKTLQGKDLAVKVQEGKVSVNDAIIQGRDMKTSNGVIHSLHTVLN